MKTDISTMMPMDAIADPEMVEFVEEATRFTASFIWC